MVSVTQKRTTAIHFSLLETGSHSPCWRWCDVNPTHPPKSWDRSTGHQPCRSSCEFVRTPMELFPLCAYWLLGKDLWKSQPLFHSGISHRCPSRVKPCLLLDRRTSGNNSKRRVSKGPPDFAVCSLPFDSQGLCWLRRRLLPVFSLQILQRALLSLTNTLMPPTVWVCLRKNDVISWRTNPAGPAPGPVSFGSELLAYCSTFPFQLCVCRHALCLPCWLVMIFFSASFYLIPFGVNPP